MHRLSIPLASLALVATAQAQFTPCTIADGAATFDFNSEATSCTSTLGLSDFDVGGGDNLYQQWWYACIDGANGACALNTVTNTCDGKLGTITSNDWDGTGKIRALWQTRVYATGPATGVVSSRMRIVNISANPVTVSLYGYTDIDNGGSANDVPNALTGWPTGNHSVTDAASPETMYVTALNYDHWEIDAFAGLRTRILTNAQGCYQLSDSVNGTPPYDYTSAFQWDVTLAPNTSFEACIDIGYDQEPTCQNHASSDAYCTFKAGTNGVPVWNLLEQPFVGANVDLSVSNGLAGSTPVVTVGTARSCLAVAPFGTFATLPIAATFNMPAFDAAGGSSVTLPVPNSTSFCGRSIYFQAFFGDPGAMGFPIAHTEGLAWSFGSF